MFSSFFTIKRFEPILYANYLLIAYAFFLPISHKISSIIMIFITVCIFLSGNIQKRFLNVIKDKIIIAFAFLYFMHLIWMLGSEHLHIGFLKLKEFQYLLFPILIMMVLQKEFVQKIFSSFFLAMFFSELISYSMNIGITFPSFFHLTMNAVNVPFMESYTQYSTILSITLGIILYQILTNHTLNLYLKILYIVFFISASFNIFIIASRIGYLLYSISILTVLGYTYRKKFLKSALFGFCIVTIGYIAAYSSSTLFKMRTEQAINDIQRITKGELDSALGARYGLFIYSYEVIKNHLLFGVGTGDHIAEVSQQILLRETRPQNIEGIMCNIRSGHNASLHSEYLDTLVQFGLIGLFIFLNLFYQIYRYPQHDSFLKMIQFLMISIMLFVSIGSVIFIPAEVGKIFMLLTTLTLNIKQIQLTSVQRST